MGCTPSDPLNYRYEPIQFKVKLGVQWVYWIPRMSEQRMNRVIISSPPVDCCQKASFRCLVN